MNVKMLALSKFTSHNASCVVFPPQGILVVTGDNGQGKSSLTEGVSWALWGKTLRGTPPWRRSGECCAATVYTDGLQATRTRAAAGKNELRWYAMDDGTELGKAFDTLYRLGKPIDVEACWEEALKADPSLKFDTATKAQEKLDELLLPHDVWRRACVFSSSDGTLFARSTDGERKRLIESFLGLDVFDPALEVCRNDLRAALSKQNQNARLIETQQAFIASNERRLTEVRQTLSLNTVPPDPPEPLTGKTSTELRAMANASANEVGVLRAKLRETDRAGATHEANMKAAKALLDRIRGSRCPTCEQAIPEEHRASVRARIEEAEVLATTAKDTVAAEAAALEATFEEISEEAQLLTKQREERTRLEAAHARALEERGRWDRQRQQLEASEADADAQLATARALLEKLEEAHAQFTKEVATLEAVEQVLGLKGVRAHILGGSLKGLQDVANTWLARLSADIRVVIKPYSEKKKGGTDDAISLEVMGAGDGYGYSATSGGERRRLDVALLLAQAEVAAAATGVPNSTLFFDEVFDCLDEAGAEAVCGVLQELAQTRCIVVITHSQVLQDQLAGCRRLHVAGGSASEIV